MVYDWAEAPVAQSNNKQSTAGIGRNLWECGGCDLMMDRSIRRFAIAAEDV